ncbi:MAG: hypothetical protein GWM90_02845 [Gemmatimonadetes bacterium]|nr:rhodanese-like domain-containing protein [Gemmatimonadota bacterium]NIQ52557.1 rhodanese-like domain-containing protein [Gemmatimonadota bacterium]NIU72695.1 hypothetical protein [Gammaproteobacteria bacterium]NIX43101.1 hypothetical protein [Gemmatimonadota bacterium]NIY07263.1 hypothetical protein [Gemmatimonadota bacterium]
MRRGRARSRSVACRRGRVGPQRRGRRVRSERRGRPVGCDRSGRRRRGRPGRDRRGGAEGAAGPGRADLDLIDVREPYEWRIFNLGDHGARLIPLGQLESRLGELDPEREIVFYCRSGHRSGDVTRYLRQRGWDRVRNLEGGILAWGDEVDPSTPRY